LFFITGYLEGNMVEAPDGTIYNILRFNTRPTMLGNYAIALKYDLKANQLTFVTISRDYALRLI
jgi:hypothetical protein